MEETGKLGNKTWTDSPARTWARRRNFTIARLRGMMTQIETMLSDEIVQNRRARVAYKRDLSEAFVSILRAEKEVARQRKYVK